jgi:hypothetical protein
VAAIRPHFAFDLDSRMRNVDDPVGQSRQLAP